MYEHDIEVDDETITVEQGDVFHVDSEIDFGDGRTLEENDIVTCKHKPISRWSTL